MQSFMNKDFMLYNDTAKRLYHEYAAALPIFDYHCHLSAKEIYENRIPENISQLWLEGDHYKWRAMRANGIDEERITGNADGYEKFKVYADTLPHAVGNPLYHWSHLELQYGDGDNGGEFPGQQSSIKNSDGNCMVVPGSQGWHGRANENSC